MGSRPKAPDNSAQIAAAQAQTQQLEKQTQQLEKQNAELKAAQEKTAMENTDKLKGIRRRQGGRALLINTSETGLTENNNIGT